MVGEGPYLISDLDRRGQRRSFSERYDPSLKTMIPVRPHARLAPNSVDDAGLLSFATFSWLTPVMIQSYKHTLTVDTLPPLSPYDASDINAKSFVISAPKVFHVGASETVVIQALGYTEAFDVTISIRSYPDRKMTYSSGCVNLSPENKFQNSTLLTIQDKQLSAGQSSFSYVYLEVVSKHFSEKRPILSNHGSLFVHTDKPVYTPQQHVKVGVLSLGDALEPVTRETVLTFIDPEGSEVDKVQGNNLTGAVSFPDFQIPSNLKYGRWTIQAKYREDASTNGTTHFEIKEHSNLQPKTRL